MSFLKMGLKIHALHVFGAIGRNCKYTLRQLFLLSLFLSVIELSFKAIHVSHTFH